MTMRAPAAELPIVFEQASFLVRDLVILQPTSLTFAAGGPIALIGPNGAGKTTLIRLAMGLVAPSSGRVTFGGRVEAPPTRRAIVFQRPAMLRRSAAGNLTYALAAAGVPRAARVDRIDELLALVGLSGLNDRPARRLSGGEQQRLALARALARDPQVLFLDEPTASLDPAATKSVEDVVREISARGVQVVMSTHDLGQARRLAGEIVLLHRGRIVESNAAAGFFAQPRTDEARRFLAGELLV
jgi:tungstate transport system ATP-binding protein